MNKLISSPSIIEADPPVVIPRPQCPPVTPAVLVADQLRTAALALQSAESAVRQAAERQPNRYRALRNALAVARHELRFAARRWQSGAVS